MGIRSIAFARRGRHRRGGVVSSLVPVLASVTSIFDHSFMRDAFLAGTGIGASCGLVGYFVVLRAQVFTGDALSHVAFTGALAALAAGFDLRLGLFGATVAVAIGMGLIARSGRADDVVIGSVFAWMLGLGVLFLSIYTAGSSGANGTAGVSVLFGSIFGLSAGAAQAAALIGACVCLGIVIIARPLLLTSIDEAVAAAAGVPVRVLGIGFLALVGVTAAETTQAVGALLLLGLLAAPAAAAHLLTERPLRGLALSAAFALMAVWAGLALSYEIPSLPPSFAIVSVATSTYAVAAAWAGKVRARGNRMVLGSDMESGLESAR
jgi:zinc/manganese transport system permease protein